jgi:hypothetical protein
MKALVFITCVQFCVMVAAQSDAASFNRSVILRPYEHDGTHSAKSWGHAQVPFERRFSKKTSTTTLAGLPSARKVRAWTFLDSRPSVPAAEVNFHMLWVLQVLQQLYLADESPGSPVKLSQVMAMLPAASYMVYAASLVFLLRHTSTLRLHRAKYRKVNKPAGRHLLVPFQLCAAGFCVLGIVSAK